MIQTKFPRRLVLSRGPVTKGQSTRHTTPPTTTPRQSATHILLSLYRVHNNDATIADCQQLASLTIASAARTQLSA